MTACQGGHQSREHALNLSVCFSFSTKLLTFPFLLNLPGNLLISSYACQCRDWESEGDLLKITQFKVMYCGLSGPAGAMPRVFLSELLIVTILLKLNVIDFFLTNQFFNYLAMTGSL